MVRLAGIIARANYNKNALQGHNENVKYGKTEIVDTLGAFETINANYCFQYWDLLEKVDMPNLTTISGASLFRGCSALSSVNFPNLINFTSSSLFNTCSSLEEIYLPNLETYSGTSPFSYCTSLKRLLLPKLTIIGSQFCEQVTSLVEMSFGKLTSVSLNYFQPQPNLRTITIGQDTDVNLPFSSWVATNVIAEGQSGIDELNNNIQNNLIDNLKDNIGATAKTVTFGQTLRNVLTTETEQMFANKNWNIAPAKTV